MKTSHASLSMALLAILAVTGCRKQAPADDATAANAPLDQPAENVPPATAPVTQPPTSAPAPVPGTWEGYGAARFGMSPEQVKGAWGGPLDGAAGTDTTCFYLRPQQADGKGSPALMFEEGKFVRYDIDTVADVAPGGGRVGMTTDQIKTAYGTRAEEQPHKYVEGAKNLRVKAESGAGVAVFETDAAGKVTSWRVGVPPQVDYVEGCS